MDLKAEAIKMLKENPEYMDDARAGARASNTVVGSILALLSGRPRQYAEQAVRDALAELGSR